MTQGTSNPLDLENPADLDGPDGADRDVLSRTGRSRLTAVLVGLLVSCLPLSGR